MNLKTLKNNVIVELIEKELETASGIILKSADPAEVNRGLVVQVGPDTEFVSIGDTILPNWNKASPLSHEGQKYYVVSEDEIVAVFEETKKSKKKR